ncbi:Os04g0482950 [Oryza sativa Japonica Group]|uniref:Os04g0482950 protein n=1 Tax=Oryza sativa subsp. japonica TaxID=39947 RepID=A0A0P0WC36_ORYSJ|nr:hypothetical protein EE612_024033 [Oryza sativa]BAS89762.1 Os04g0482950 [Oryza sativa Japonica Group]
MRRGISIQGEGFACGFRGCVAPGEAGLISFRKMERFPGDQDKRIKHSPLVISCTRSSSIWVKFSGANQGSGDGNFMIR